MLCGVAVAIPVPRSAYSAERWSWVLAHWQPERAYLYGPGEVPRSALTHYPRVDHWADAAQGEVVLLSPANARYTAGSKPLPAFVHPPSACYLVGPNHLNFELDRKVDHRVFIPTSTHHEMHNWLALGVALYDRSVKRG